MRAMTWGILSSVYHSGILQSIIDQVEVNYQQLHQPFRQATVPSDSSIPLSQSCLTESMP